VKARDAGAHLQQFYISGSKWVSYDISAATGTTIAGDPTEGSNGVMARDAAGHLQQFYVNSVPQWVSYDISAATGTTIAGDPAEGSNGVMALG
jgi:hypothetical protein